MNKINPNKIKFILSRFFSYPLVHPQYFMIEITDYCNLKCIMCNSNKRLGHMDYDLLINIFDQINNFSRGRKIIQITGGEPLLHPQFKQISRYIVDSPNIFHLSSNGLLINRFFEEILNYHLVNISLDGFNEANDLVRGEGVFKKISDNIKELYNYISERKNRFELCFNILITRYNYQDLFSFVKYLHNIYPYSKFQILNVIEDNSYTNSGLNDKLGLVENPERLREEISKIRSFCFDNKCDFFYPEAYLEYLIAKKYQYWKCYAGYNRLIVSVTGDVWLCNTSLGNIKKEKLKKIWYSERARDFRERAKSCKTHCFQDCYMFKNI